MKWFPLLFIGVTAVVVDSASESRIWYEGEKIPGTNMTVPRHRDPSASGTIPGPDSPTNRFNDAGNGNKGNPSSSLPDYSSMTIGRPIGVGVQPANNVGTGNNGYPAPGSGSNVRPNYTSMTIDSPIGNGNTVNTVNNGYSRPDKPEQPSRPMSDNSGQVSNKRYPSGDNQGNAGYAVGGSQTSNSVNNWNPTVSPNNQWSGGRYPSTTVATTQRPYYTTPRPYYTTQRPPQRYDPVLSPAQYPAYSPNSKTTLFGLSLDKVLSRGIAKLALDLDRTIDRPGNLVFSPTSISAALALLLLGAAGKTKEDLYRMLGVHQSLDATIRSELHLELGNIFKSMESSKAQEFGPQFSFACGVFVQQGFSVTNKFAVVAQSIYQAQVVSLDFRRHPDLARSSINKWISDKTFGRINNVIAENMNPNTRAVIANALYFNGQWQHPFHIPSTRNKPFYVSESETVEVPTMVNAAEVYFHDNKKRGYKAMGLPYKGGDVAMFLVLPEGDLRSFVRSMSPLDLEEIVNETSIQQVIFTVPRMKLSSTVNLRRPLEEMGARSLFDPRRSDLSNLAEGVVLSDAVHKVVIDVTETGTVAAATTAFTLTRDGTTPVFRADRPFLFFLFHLPSKFVTFWGTVYKPTPNYPLSDSHQHN